MKKPIKEILEILEGHRDWCAKYSKESEKDMGRFIGADEMWELIRRKLIPALKVTKRKRKQP